MLLITHTQMVAWSGALKDGLHHRYDPLTGQWVAVAYNRDARPNLYTQKHPAKSTGPVCPFCKPNFDRDLNVPVAESADGAVFQNAFPYVSGDIGVDSDGIPHGGAALMICPWQHADRVESVNSDWFIDTWLDRCRVDQLDGFTFGVISEGAASGGTLPHVHAQAVTLPYRVGNAQREIMRTQVPSGCVLCATSQFEIVNGSRLVAVVDGAVAWIPWWMGDRVELIISSTAHDGRIPAEIVRKVGAMWSETFGTSSPRRWTFHGGLTHDHIHVGDASGALTFVGDQTVGWGVQTIAPEVVAAWIRNGSINS